VCYAWREIVAPVVSGCRITLVIPVSQAVSFKTACFNHSRITWRIVEQQIQKSVAQKHFPNSSLFFSLAQAPGTEALGGGPAGTPKPIKQPYIALAQQLILSFPGVTAGVVAGQWVYSS
jgi:hypothetical protein